MGQLPQSSGHERDLRIIGNGPAAADVAHRWGELPGPVLARGSA